MARFGRNKVGFRKNVNIPRIVAKITATAIALYVGNEIIDAIGGIMLCNTGSFNGGFELIGWDVTDGLVANATTKTVCSSVNNSVLVDGTTYNNILTSVNGGAVLTVIGIVGFASIVMEFVKFNM